MTRRFNIEIRDYEPGRDPDPLTINRIEGHLVTILDIDGSGGIVIVTDASEATS